MVYKILKEKQYKKYYFRADIYVTRTYIDVLPAIRIHYFEPVYMIDNFSVVFAWLGVEIRLRWLKGEYPNAKF